MDKIRLRTSIRCPAVEQLLLKEDGRLADAVFKSVIYTDCPEALSARRQRVQAEIECVRQESRMLSQRCQVDFEGYMHQCLPMFEMLSTGLTTWEERVELEGLSEAWFQLNVATWVVGYLNTRRKLRSHIRSATMHGLLSADDSAHTLCNALKAEIRQHDEEKRLDEYMRTLETALDTVKQRAAENLRPESRAEFHLFMTSRYEYFDLLESGFYTWHRWATK